MRSPCDVAVIGSGVAGLTAAWSLTRAGSRVTLFEADHRLGGHADTHVVAGLAIDTGFIVHNERTYPTLLRLFADLGIGTQESEMSMSISSPSLEWAGALGWRGLFPERRNLTSPAYLRMLTELPRFHRAARALLASGPGDDRTLAEFLDTHRFSPFFRRNFMEPLVAAVWSCDPERALEYPAAYLFEFLHHHGMLSVFGSPTWRTVTGGCRTYVEQVAAALHDVRTGVKVTSLVETTEGVLVTDGNGEVTTYDAAVVATHPDQALAMLAEPTVAQREVLGAIIYSTNTAQLHTDTALLPNARRAWASWNFRRRPGEGGLTVTYDLTRLMGLPTSTHYLVTLGGTDLVDPEAVIATREYAHPLYTPTSVAAQCRLPELDSDRLVFAGAWQGWGFHEEGARSGVRAAERLGADLGSPVGSGRRHAISSSHFRPDYPGPDRSGRPTTYDVTIRHTRREPFRRSFTYRSSIQLVDLDHLPSRGFEARDHLGDPTRTIRENVVAFLARHGVERPARIRMLANRRGLGYCFNPISVFWCVDPAGVTRHVVIEVHNTYGDRHAYLVTPDAHGKATVDKAMYVSPFHDVSGSYDIAVPNPGDTVAVSIGLGSFQASLTGRRTTTPLSSLRLAALLGTARIRWHGLRLWARLPIYPRPPAR